MKSGFPAGLYSYPLSFPSQRYIFTSMWGVELGVEGRGQGEAGLCPQPHFLNLFWSTLCDKHHENGLQIVPQLNLHHAHLKPPPQGDKVNGHQVEVT
jgi:hypothetical protein